MIRSAARRVAARNPRKAHSKKAPKNTAVRNRSHETASKVAAKLRNNVAARRSARHTGRSTLRSINSVDLKCQRRCACLPNGT